MQKISSLSEGIHVPVNSMATRQGQKHKKINLCTCTVEKKRWSQVVS